MASRTPRARSWCSRWPMASASSSTDSVISSTTRRGSMPVRARMAGHGGDRTRVEDLAGGQVHGDRRRWARSAPARRPARAPTSRWGRWRRSPRRGARRASGAEQAPLGVLPAHQGLVALDLQGHEVDDRLEVHSQLDRTSTAVPARRPPARAGRRPRSASGARTARPGPCRSPWRRTWPGRRPAARPRRRGRCRWPGRGWPSTRRSRPRTGNGTSRAASTRWASSGPSAAACSPSSEDGELVAAEPGDRVPSSDARPQPLAHDTSSWSPAS